MLSVAPALANIAGAAAAVSAALTAALSALAFSPDEHATLVAAMRARGSLLRGSRTMLRMDAPWVVEGEGEDVARTRLASVERYIAVNRGRSFREEACCHSERRPKAGGEESQSSW